MRKGDFCRRAAARPRWLEKARKVIVAMIAATTCSWPPPAHASGVKTALYEIASDSTRIVTVRDGHEIISAQNLLYSLPDSVYAVEYGKAYYVPPRTLVSDRKPWRRLEHLSVAPDGGHVAVIANDGGGVDVVLKRIPHGPMMVVGWWHHWGADSLYWSPDSRYLLIALDGGQNSKIIVLELMPESADPVQRVAALDTEISWKFSGEPPAWDTDHELAQVSLTAIWPKSDTQTGNASPGATRTNLIFFSRTDTTNGLRPDDRWVADMCRFGSGLDTLHVEIHIDGVYDELPPQLRGPEFHQEGGLGYYTWEVKLHSNEFQHRTQVTGWVLYRDLGRLFRLPGVLMIRPVINGSLNID
jgi:hypothetical protein